jgi:signal transduction histidine kinase
MKRGSLQARALALAVGAVLVPAALVGVSVRVGLGELQEAWKAGTNRTAVALAGQLEATLRGASQALLGAAAEVDPESEPGPALRTALRRATLEDRRLEAAFLTRHTVVVIEEPPREPPTRLGPEAQAALESGRPRLVPCGDRLCLVVSVSDVHGQVAGLVGGVLAEASLRGPLAAAGPAAIVDAGGRVVAGTAAIEGGAEAELPVVGLRLRVAPEQPLARLDRRMLWTTPGLLALALLYAWGAARSVRQPVVVLTRAAERVAAGDLSTPVPAVGSDEVGRLGRAVEKMRGSLTAALADLEKANQELERRVDQRTRELSELYERLREREAWRGALLRRAISAHEEERRRVARELHDETCQTLAALTLALSQAGSDPQAVERARGMAERALADVHHVIHDLRPSILDDLGLVPALTWYAARHLEPIGISVRFEAEGLPERLPTAIETALFRIAQEALSNVARHARAENVLVQIEVEGGLLRLEVEDDGAGFVPAEVAPGDGGRGLGLMGMRERAELLGGTLLVDSAPGEGTHLVLTVPL